MSDVDAALHPWGGRNIDPGQITLNQPHTLVLHRDFAFLRSVNVRRFGAVHQAVRAADDLGPARGWPSAVQD